MQKIVFFINGLGIGGAEHALIDTANNLDPEKFDVTIQTIYDTNVYKEQINNNVKVQSYYHSKRNPFIDKVFRKILYWKIRFYKDKWLYKMFIKEKYDIEIAFLEGLPTKILAASTSKAKKIAWVHCDFGINKDADYFFDSLQQQIQAYKSYDEVYCVSKRAEISFRNRFFNSDNIYVMYNLIDKERIQKLAIESVDDLEVGLKLISVGRLTKEKGYPRLIEAYAEALESIKEPCTLYIVGDGEERAIVEAKIKEQGLVEKVVLLGAQSNPYKYVSKCDLFICSSYSEGYSLTTQEALELNIPVLSTDCADQKNALGNGEFGLVVENTKDALRDGIITLINDKDNLQKYVCNIRAGHERIGGSIELMEKQILK